ncbi:archease [Candidatus Woesearchaeota archaeon]|nr:archease [Candidatus Woesearchaeota archaeon]
MSKHKVEEITISEKASSLEASFSKIAKSLFEIVINTEEIDLAITKTLIIRARDLKNLLFQFLKRLFELANNELFVLSAIKQITIEQISNEYMLNAVLIGDKMKSDYTIKDIVKQITDRNILIREDKEGVTTQINIVVERRNVKEDEV